MLFSVYKEYLYFFLLKVIDSVKGIIEAKSANYFDELESMLSTWDGEIRSLTRYANLINIQNIYLVMSIKQQLFNYVSFLIYLNNVTKHHLS